MRLFVLVGRRGKGGGTLDLHLLKSARKTKHISSSDDSLKNQQGKIKSFQQMEVEV